MMVSDIDTIIRRLLLYNISNNIATEMVYVTHSTLSFYFSGIPRVSFEKETYIVDESDGYVEVCFFINNGHTEPIDVVIAPIMKGVNNPAASNYRIKYKLIGAIDCQIMLSLLLILSKGNTDFDARPRMLTFEASSTGGVLCVNITILEDTLYEGNEQFLLTFGNLPNGEAAVGPIVQSCITIRDDDS